MNAYKLKVFFRLQKTKHPMPKGYPISSRIMKGAFILFCICLLFFHPGMRTAAAGNVEEYAVKSAFVFNFTKFVQWPENALAGDAKAYHILVFGSDDVARQFSAIDGQNNGMGTIRVHHADPQTLEKDAPLSQCHVVFISQEISPPESQRILRQTNGKPILSIGETRNFSRTGGIINFFSKEGHLHFEINTKTAEAHGLKFSSRLLRIAFIVDE